MNRLLLLLLLFLFQNVFSQDIYWRKKIGEVQKQLCKKTTDNNCIISISNNPETNLVVTSFIINKVNDWQRKTETDTTISNNNKVIIYRVIINQLTKFNYYAKNSFREKGFSPGLAQELFQNFDLTIAAFLGKKSFYELIEPLGFLASKIIVEDIYAEKGMGIREAKELLVYKECLANHDNILSVISKHPNNRYADTLIQIAAFENQDRIYDFAQCKTCPLYNKLKNHPNPFVQTLFKMAQLESGRSLTPFLDLISRKELSIDSLNKIQESPTAYFKLMVQTRQGFLDRIARKEPILALNNFNSKMKDVAVSFVNQINEAHDKPDNIRFEPLNPFTSSELYYIAVLGIDDLYTSSFIRGVFAQMIGKWKGAGTDLLLDQLHDDYFRKFIKIAAGYNKLSVFLKGMPDSSARLLMTRFVSNLIHNEDLFDIEDAVDVADAFGGIGNNPDLKTISSQIISQVKQFRAQYQKEENMKGETIYRLFDIIFNSFKDTSAGFAAQLNIPPITKLDYQTITNGSGKTIVKLYFFSDPDKDGQNSYANFLGLFGDKTRWKIESNPYFVIISSLKGSPVQIFANKALYDPTKIKDLADTTKQKMSEYMQQKGLSATFIIHRGHSYHVPISLRYIEQFDTAAKIIILGSCGSYQNLMKALEISPDAHIITSKQTGSMRVNDPMLRVLLNDFNAGKSILWPEIWPRIKSAVGGGEPGEMFNEYLAPYQNLGMIFIKAYKRQMQL